MQRKLQERELARAMRHRGASLRAIARELGVALSSVSIWVRDVRRPADRLLELGGFPLRDIVHVRLPVWASRRVRRCYRCKRLLPEVAFTREQYRCRRCTRAYFVERGELHRLQSGEARRRRRLRAKAHVLAYLRTRCCADCGEADPVVLEFDHLAAKRGHISQLAHAGVRPERLDEEMATCDVVCACCHRRRTDRRRATPAAPTPRRARNATFVRSFLEQAMCADCGESDPEILEFDHIGPKRGDVSRLAYREASLATLQREIAQCEVRCVNCHRRQTAGRGQHFRWVAES